MRVPEERQTLTTRITVLRVAAVVLFALLAVSFWFFQIIQHAKFQEMAENNHQRELPLRAPRGVLFDRNGRVLVENRPSFNVSIVRLHTTNLDRTIRLLAAVAGADERRMQEVVDRHRQRAALPADRGDRGRDAGAGRRHHRAAARLRAARRRRAAGADAPVSRPTSSRRTCSGTSARRARRRWPRATAREERRHRRAGGLGEGAQRRC